MRAATAEQAADDPMRASLLLPSLRRLTAPHAHGARALDAGCGGGDTTALLADLPTSSVLAVDSDPRAVSAVAGLDLPDTRGLVHDFGQPLPLRRAIDLVLASMVLHLVEDLAAVVRHTTAPVRDGGVVIAAIPHPMLHADTAQVCRRRSADDGDGLPTLAYDAQRPLVNTFGHPPVDVPMFHRPLGAYVGAFTAAGLAIEKLEEPVYRGPQATSVWQRVPPFAFFVLRRRA